MKQNQAPQIPVRRAHVRRRSISRLGWRGFVGYSRDSRPDNNRFTCVLRCASVLWSFCCERTEREEIRSMSNERKLPYFNPELLIQEIRKHPLLYNTEVPEYSDRLKKLRVWHDICHVLISNWEELPTADKNLFSKEVQSRWRSIRDSFVKDYRKFKKCEANGVKPPKRKKYIYYEQLTFLIDTMEKRRVVENHISEDISTRSEEEQDLPLNDAPQLNFNKHNIEYTHFSRNSNWTQPKENFETEVLDALRQLKQGLVPPEQDEDRLFLLSLISYFRKMDDDTKMNVRIEILHCVQHALTQMKEKLQNSELNIQADADLDIKPFHEYQEISK